MQNLGRNHTAFLPADNVIPMTGSVLHFLSSLKRRAHLSTMAAPRCPELAGELLCGSDSEHPWRSLRSENSGVVGKELKHARES